MPHSATLDFVRLQYANVESWYTSADNQGQIILAINGALLAIAGGATLSTSARTNDRFSWATIAFLILAGLLSVISSTCGVRAICARPKTTDGGAPASETAGPTANLWSVPAILCVPKTARAGVGEVEDMVDSGSEAELFMYHTLILARLVPRKQRLVLVGFRLFLVSLIALVGAVTSDIGGF